MNKISIKKLSIILLLASVTLGLSAQRTNTQRTAQEITKNRNLIGSIFVELDKTLGANNNNFHPRPWLQDSNDYWKECE